VSIINRMLLELDGRNALRADPQAQTLAAKVRPISPSGKFGSEVFWRVLAFFMVLLVGWVLWVVWQLTPRSVVTPLALELGGARRPAPTPPPAAASETAQQAAAVSPAAGAEAGGPAVAARVDTLRLSTELSNAPTAPPKPRAAAPEKSAKAPAATPADRATVASVATAVEPKPEAPKAVPTARAAAGDLPRIDKRVAQGPQERADREYQRALGFINQGRVAEGVDGLQATLAADPAHEQARQALVTLLVESKRYDDAVRAMNEGLVLNPSNLGMAMRLARVHVERGDVAQALSVLENSAPAGAQNADFHAFRAALYQRANRHGDAVVEYEQALKLAPASGAWWIGRGISLQALERPKEALEAFRRAKVSGNLTPDLLSFADQRIRQLQ
jgi:MSHA biogenesis protein MshN